MRNRTDLLTAWSPCPPEYSADALVTLSHVPWLESWGYVADGQRVWWTLKDAEGRDCAHLTIERHVQRSISLHTALKRR